MSQVNASKKSSILRDRLPVLTKIIYGSGTALDMWGLWLYPAVAYAVFNIYLGVEPWLVGLALTLIRLYDAIADPICGWLSDNLRSKFGRRRPFILIFGILSGLGLPALFLVSPEWVNIKIFGLSSVFWYMIFSSLIYIPIISAFSMPYNSLGAEMTPDYDERTSIQTYRSAIQKVFEVGNFYALRFTNLAWFLIPATGEKNTLLGIQVYTAILGGLMAIFAIIIALNVKERYYEKVATKQDKISLKESFYQTIKCSPFRTMLGVGISFQLGTSMVGALGYYATVYYVFAGNTRVGDNWNFYIGLAFMFGGFIAAPILARVSNYLAKRRTGVVACLIGIVGFGGSWFFYNPNFPGLQVLASFLMGCAGAGLWMIYGAIGADIIDYDELHTGKRREGAFSSCGSYILKLGNSLGYFISGLILQWAGFDHSIAIQADHTIFWIRFMLASIPVFGLVIAIVLFLRFPLTKKSMLDIRDKLEDRRGTV